MLDRFTACWDLRHPFLYITCFYCQLGTLFNSELIKLNSLRIFFLSWSKTNCQNTPEISPGKSRRCRQVFSKAQFLSFYFSGGTFKSQIMSQMQQVGVGASALSQTGPLHHQGHKGPTDAPQVEMAHFSSWKRGKSYTFTWEILAREIKVVGSKLLWIRTLIFTDNIFIAFKVAGGPQTNKEKKKHCLWGAPPVLLFDQVDQTTGTKTEVVWLLRQMDL